MSFEVNLASDAMTPDASPALEQPLSTAWARLGRKTAAFTIANFGTKVLSFVVLIPIYTRFLSPSDYGIVSLSEAIAIVVATIYASTFEVSLQRFYHRHQDPAHRKACVNTIMQCGALIMLAICALAFATGPYVLHHIFPHFAVPFYPYIAIAIGTLAVNQAVSYRLVLYQAEQRAFGYVALSLTLFAGVSSCGLYLVAVRRGGALGMLVGKFVPTAIVALFCIFLLRRWLTLHWDRETLHEFARFSAPMALYPFIILGLNIADRLLLQRYRSIAEVGIYSLAYGVGMAMSLMALSLYQSWTPVFYKTAAQGTSHQGKNAKLITTALLLKIVVAILGVALSPIFVTRLIDPRYRAGAVLVPYIIVGYLLRGFTFSFHVPLLAAGKTLATSVSGALALIVNLGLNLAFIPRYGMYAAAYATVVAYAIELIAVFICAQRICPLQYGFGKIAVAMALLAITFLVSQSSVAENVPVLILTVTSAGGGVAFLLKKMMTPDSADHSSVR